MIRIAGMFNSFCLINSSLFLISSNNLQMYFASVKKTSHIVKCKRLDISIRNQNAHISNLSKHLKASLKPTIITSILSLYIFMFLRDSHHFQRYDIIRDEWGFLPNTLGDMCCLLFPTVMKERYIYLIYPSSIHLFDSLDSEAEWRVISLIPLRMKDFYICFGISPEDIMIQGNDGDRAVYNIVSKGFEIKNQIEWFDMEESLMPIVKGGILYLINLKERLMHRYNINNWTSNGHCTTVLRMPRRIINLKQDFNIDFVPPKYTSAYQTEYMFNTIYAINFATGEIVCTDDEACYNPLLGPPVALGSSIYYLSEKELFSFEIGGPLQIRKGQEQKKTLYLHNCFSLQNRYIVVYELRARIRIYDAEKDSWKTLDDVVEKGDILFSVEDQYIYYVNSGKGEAKYLDINLIRWIDMPIISVFRDEEVLWVEGTKILSFGRKGMTLQDLKGGDKRCIYQGVFDRRIYSTQPVVSGDKRYVSFCDNDKGDLIFVEIATGDVVKIDKEKWMPMKFIEE
jgi:hypothetical protein